MPLVFDGFNLAIPRNTSVKPSFPVVLVLAVVLVTLAGGGCRRGRARLVEVTGTVSYQGKPVPKANVIFQPQEGPPAMAVCNEQGEFKLATDGRPGAVAGPMTVAVSAVEVIKSIPPGDEYPEGLSITRPRIPAKYALVATSPLQVEVSASGENHFDLELTD